MTWVSIAVVLSLVGIVGLLFQWKARQTRPLNNTFFWLLILLSVFGWILASGVEFGIIYALGCVGAFALTAAIFTGSYKHAKRAPNLTYRRVSQSRSLWLRNIGYAALVVPISAFTAATGTIAILRLLPLTQVNEIVAVAFLVPISWGILAYWACAQQNLFRPALLYVFSGGLFSTSLFFL